MKEFKYTIDGKQYVVVINSVEGDNVNLSVNGETYDVALEPKKVEPKKKVKVTPPAPAPKAATVSADGTINTQDALKAPLPGVINEICVAVGDKVEEGQTLVVLEAMKMANNLDSETSGVVKAILVNEGDSVMENTPLVVVG